jgi:hypothetical protein
MDPMSKLRTGLITIAACTLTALVSGPAFQAASGAEADTTPPTGSIEKDFLVGSQVTASNLLNQADNECDDYTWVKYLLTWTASDASGISDATAWEVTSASSPDFLGWASQDLPGDDYFYGEMGDYEGDCGGGSLETDTYAVTAYDTYGNAKWIETPWGGPTVIQENGATPFGSDPSMFTYSGKWSTATVTYASGGRQKWTKQAGASVTFQAAGEVALVMAKGPGRGQAAIFIDGVRVSTVDTRAATNSNRIIVWTRDLPSGTHTIQIRNLATAGHPRIDFDAIVLG